MPAATLTDLSAEAIWQAIHHDKKKAAACALPCPCGWAKYAWALKPRKRPCGLLWPPREGKEGESDGVNGMVQKLVDTL